MDGGLTHYSRRPRERKGKSGEFFPHHRLDFEDFEMDPGSSKVRPCDLDSVDILSTGVSELGIGRLCGTNTGQHVYIPVMSSQSRPMLRVMAEDRSVNASIRPYKYRIKVTQIDCTSGNEMMRRLRGKDELT